MTNIRTLENDLNQLILAGKGMDGFEKHYADDVVMQENVDEPRVGKDASREYEQKFFGMITEFHGAELLNSSVEGDRSYSEWVFDMTLGDTRLRNTQVASRTWKDGKVVREQFFYQPNVVS